MPKKVLVPLAEGFEEIEAVGMIDTVRRGGIDVVICAMDAHMDVKGAHGITIRADASLGDFGADDIDMIVLPGGWGGTERLAADARVQSLLKAMDEKAKAIGAICAAPYALNAAGVLKERFTCYPGVEAKIRKEGFLGDGAQVVEDGNVMTSRGPGTAICFGLQIVKKLAGEATYEQVKSKMLATYCD